MADDDGDERAGEAAGRGSRHSAGPRQSRQPRAPKPLDAEQLQALALHYAARYATTVARLHRYLERKLRERGWSGETAPDADSLVARIAALGYVNDRAFADARARDLTARGLGSRRVRAALSDAGVGRDDVAATLDPGDEGPGDAPMTTAIAFARRRRLGPFARDPGSTDPARQRRELAAMARAGHDFETARKVLAAASPAAAEALAEGTGGGDGF